MRTNVALSEGVFMGSLNFTLQSSLLCVLCFGGLLVKRGELTGGKLTAFIGPLLLGILTQAFDSQRAGVAIVLVLFVLGLVLLARVDEREGIELCPLYFAKDGKRFRSLGCAPCTGPIESNASTVREIIEELENTNTAERAGRAQDQENAYAMQKLRARGYM